MTERIITRPMVATGEVKVGDRVVERVDGERPQYGTVDRVDMCTRDIGIRWDADECLVDSLVMHGFADTAEEEYKACARVYLIDENEDKQLYTVLHYDTVKLRNANREEVKEFFATLEDSVGWSIIEQQHIKPVKLTKRVVFDVDF